MLSAWCSGASGAKRPPVHAPLRSQLILVAEQSRAVLPAALVLAARTAQTDPVWILPLQPTPAAATRMAEQLSELIRDRISALPVRAAST